MIEVLDGGFLTTVQDRGRYGYQQFGIPVAGPMDIFALAAANALVGNFKEAAGLEMTLVGPCLRFSSPALLAITGADFQPALSRWPVPMWTAVLARSQDVLSFQAPVEGVRAYLALAGGIDVPTLMGSRSTYLPGKLGGLAGRALQAGDTLRLLAAKPGSLSRAGAWLPGRARPAYAPQVEVGVIPGPHLDHFTPAGIRAFWEGPYTISLDSNRMGVRLQGPAIAHHTQNQILSQGTAWGAIQVPAGGQPIVLMADRQATGGYPMIGTIISADMPLVAQLRSGDTIRFRETNVPAALALQRERQSHLEQINAGQEYFLGEWPAL